MCSDRSGTPAIDARGLSKCYHLYDRPSDRLKQMLWRGRRKYHREFWALRDVDLRIEPGEILGIVGRNGAGKSTLLQLLCGTLTPTAGSLVTNGRIAALLELGSGFNPEFSGRENVYMSASILGLSGAEIDRRFDEIVDFSGIRDFIDQPVKTYSSGMYVRLAFSVATSVDPDILVIDEALSVGDGEFARRSFDRIMALKEAGRTILFCSHALYFIDALCTRAVWLRDGRVEMDDRPARVVGAYGAFVDGPAAGTRAKALGASASADGTLRFDMTATDASSTAGTRSANDATAGAARIRSIELSSDGATDRRVAVDSGRSTVEVTVRFASDPELPSPSVGIAIVHAIGVVVASAGTVNDGYEIVRDERGDAAVTLVLPSIPLLKGEYTLSVFLFCERGILMYDHAERCATLDVSQDGLEQGIVSLEHHWRSAAASDVADD